MTEPFISHSEITGAIYIVCDTKKYNMTEQVIRAMRETGRLEQQRPHGEWIPCSERLPNTNGIYIITRNIAAHFILDVSYFDGSNTWHADNRINHSRDYLTDVVAWMPLPEPYKKEGEAE